MTKQESQRTNWPDNIVADRHEVSGKWVLHYLTDEQAAKCAAAMQPAPVSAEAGELTGRQLHLEYTQTLGGLMTGGFGFLLPRDKEMWEYCAKRINQEKVK